MKGKHHVVVESARLKYEFHIQRNITIIEGNSATGKTTLIDLLRDYANDRSGQSISLQSDVPCVVFGGDRNFWEIVIRSIENSIIFIDENYPFIFSKEFAAVVRDSSCYFVLITRRPLTNLPYSIKEIYGIRTSGRFHFPEKIYHEFYPVYQEFLPETRKPAPILITEDSMSGFQFFKVASGGKIHCESAGGNSNIYAKLLSMRAEEQLLVIADGAAFGTFISAVVAFSKAQKNTSLYFPESFEWLILKSGAVTDAEVRNILLSPEDYIESSVFFSWERFFTEVPAIAACKCILPIWKHI